MATTHKAAELDPDDPGAELSPAGRYIRDAMGIAGFERPADLAMSADVTAATLSKIFSGSVRVGLEVGQKLAAALGVPVVDLLIGVGALDASARTGAQTDPEIAWLVNELQRMPDDQLKIVLMVVRSIKAAEGVKTKTNRK